MPPSWVSDSTTYYTYMHLTNEAEVGVYEMKYTPGEYVARRVVNSKLYDKIFSYIDEISKEGEYEKGYKDERITEAEA